MNYNVIIHMINIKERIRHFQKLKNMNNNQLARAANLNPSVICSIFTRNYEPTLTTLDSICRGFGITMSEFFAEEDKDAASSGSRQEFMKIIKKIPESKLESLAQFLKSVIN